MNETLKNVSIIVKIMIPIMLLAAVQVITVIVNTSSMDSIMDASKEVSEDCATSMSLLGEISTDFEEMEKIAYAHCVADSASTMRSLEASIKDVYAEIVKPIAQSRKQLEVRLMMEEVT